MGGLTRLGVPHVFIWCFATPILVLSGVACLTIVVVLCMQPLVVFLVISA